MPRVLEKQGLLSESPDFSELCPPCLFKRSSVSQCTADTQKALWQRGCGFLSYHIPVPISIPITMTEGPQDGISGQV